MTEEDQQALNDKDKSMNKGQDSELDEKEIYAMVHQYTIYPL